MIHVGPQWRESSIRHLDARSFDALLRHAGKVGLCSEIGFLSNYHRHGPKRLLWRSSWGCFALQLYKEARGQFRFPFCIRHARPAQCKETFS